VVNVPKEIECHVSCHLFLTSLMDALASTKMFAEVAVPAKQLKVALQGDTV
jgi:hypothetical protein